MCPKRAKRLSSVLVALSTANSCSRKAGAAIYVSCKLAGGSSCSSKLIMWVEVWYPVSARVNSVVNDPNSVDGHTKVITGNNVWTTHWMPCKQAEVG
jgi:hypothetical protein